MARPLDDYQKKRDFARTPEPAAEVPPARAGELVFVVHRHEARNLHYDLRLEMDGVLWSWAVPKGFSFDPTEKHLAVRTEDHPLRYVDFDGVIPKGEYGAGTMRVWDRGTYEHLLEPDVALAKGELKLYLRGRRLRGEFHLVKTRGGPNHWLLFKSRDRFAGPARDTALGVDLAAARVGAPPARLRLPEPAETAAPFTDAAWLFEARFAGRRLLAEKAAERVTLRGLRGRLPAAVAAGLAELRAERALLDGVLVALDPHERPDAALLEEVLKGRAEAPLAYYAFDLLFWEEYDLRPLALVERKSALRAVLSPHPAVLYLDHVTGDGERLAAAVAAAGLPGLVAKRAAAPWSGGPTSDWRSVPVDSAQNAGPLRAALARTQPKGGARRSRVKLTNLGKVFWPAEGYTKGDLVAYYESVADVILPYLRGRPVHLLRYPDGIEGKSFYQRHATEQIADWVETVEIASAGKEPERFLLCNDRETLVYLANLGSIDLHPWFSRAETPLSPDWAVIDLDPKEAPFTDVVKVARVVGKVLRGIGLRPLLKTSGATGLHVYVPLVPGYTYEQARMFCETVARIIAREHPQIATVTRQVGRRQGKVYVDFGQNGREQTIAGPYVVRPKPGATVSTPLQWDELERADLAPALFDIRTVPERLDRVGDLFRPLLTDLQDLGPAIEGLHAYLGR